MAVVTAIDMDTTILMTVTSAINLTMAISMPINMRPDFGDGTRPNYWWCCSLQSMIRQGLATEHSGAYSAKHK